MTPEERVKAAQDAKEAAEKAEAAGNLEEAAQHRDLFKELSKPTEVWEVQAPKPAGSG